ncbi:MAG: alpha/beta hydrolase [Candidatus Altiarchaeota archaeon]|nr:alpha/beta hydrolase [Candidatus Altiarchaeota archaeon]
MFEQSSGQKKDQLSSTLVQLADAGENIEQYEGRIETTKGFDLYFRLFKHIDNSSDHKKTGLVALHGTTSHGGTFKKAIESLINDAQYAWIVTPDTPGHAKSSTLEGEVDVSDYADAIGELVNTLYQNDDISGDRVLTANSGHSAIAVEMYNQHVQSELDDLSEGDSESIKGIILSGPVYHSRDTFLGRFGPVLVSMLGKIPDKIINLPQTVTRLYGKYRASNEREAKIQQTRKVDLSNKSLYQDVRAMERFYREHQVDGDYRPLIVNDDMNVAIIKSKKDNLSNGNEQLLRTLHGKDVILKITGNGVGHHPHKESVKWYATTHREVLEEFAARDAKRAYLEQLN